MTTRFPVLRDLSPEALELLKRNAMTVRLPAGHAVTRPGDPCETIALILEGEVRVHQLSATGRDLTLYRIEAGQSCVLTAMSMLANQVFPAYAHVSEECTALVIPRTCFQYLFNTEQPWRQFIFGTVSTRLGELLELIDDVIFTDLPPRLANTLLTWQEAGLVRLTHEQIAAEIGCSREAVSRLLKGWEREGFVRLSRGMVAVIDRAALVRLAARPDDVLPLPGPGPDKPAA